MFEASTYLRRVGRTSWELMRGGGQRGGVERRDEGCARENENFVYGSLVKPAADPAPHGRKAARASEEVSTELSKYVKARSSRKKRGPPTHKFGAPTR
jgi:hypothetical protein